MTTERKLEDVASRYPVHVRRVGERWVVGVERGRARDRYEAESLSAAIDLAYEGTVER